MSKTSAFIPSIQIPSFYYQPGAFTATTDSYRNIFRSVPIYQKHYLCMCNHHSCDVNLDDHQKRHEQHHHHIHHINSYQEHHQHHNQLHYEHHHHQQQQVQLQQQQQQQQQQAQEPPPPPLLVSSFSTTQVHVTRAQFLAAFAAVVATALTGNTAPVQAAETQAQTDTQPQDQTETPKKLSKKEQREAYLEKKKKEKCKNCQGTGVITCDLCGGTGFWKAIMNNDPNQRYKGVPCPTCDGKGTLKCTVCLGTGQGYIYGLLRNQKVEAGEGRTLQSN